MTDILNALAILGNFVIVPGLTYGSQLALGALGATLVFGILRFSNFAHGDMMAFGTMVTILVTWWLQSMGVSIKPLPSALLALPVGILVAALLALLTDRAIYRYYRKQKSRPITFVIASVGVMFIMNGLVRFIIGPGDQRFNDGERFIFNVREFKAFTGLAEGIGLRWSQGITIVVAILVVVALFWFLQRTRTGKSMRAFSDNEDLALLSGINPDRVVMVTWILAAALANDCRRVVRARQKFQTVHLLPIAAANLRRGDRGRYWSAAWRHRWRLCHRLLGSHHHLCLQAGLALCAAGRLGTRRAYSVAVY